MTHLRSLLLLVLTATALQAAAPWDHGKLQVSPNQRYLQHADGTPFFWLGDTCWLIFQKLDRAEVKTYFENRRAKGFNVVQACVVQFPQDANPFAGPALVDKDITRLATTPGNDPANPAEYDYWDHVDYIFDTAAANGIYIAIAPLWSHMVRRTPITAEQAKPYATALAQRLKNKPNLIWLNGGSAKGDLCADVWQTVAETIKAIDPVHLMTFHPFGRTQTSTWYQDTAWLDFNTFTSGHRRYDQDTDGKKFGEDNWRYVLEDLAKTPLKPTLDSEPAYEDTPQGLHKPEEPYWTADDARRYAWWSVFAGSCGHTYGQNSVRQVYIPAETKPASGAKGYIFERLETPAARQMRHVKNLILSRPYYDRINDQSLVTDQGEKYDAILVTRGQDYLFAYTYTGRPFTLKLGALTGKKLTATWYNPRTGETLRHGKIKNTATATFDPPGEKTNANDWVLVLDNPAKKFPAPGQPL